MFLLVMSEILRLFANTLPVNNKFSLRNSEKLWQLIQMHLSKKQKSKIY